MNLSRRDFLGSIACAFAAAGVASRIPLASIVEPVKATVLIASSPDGVRLFNAGEVLRFVVSVTNTGPTTMNVGGLGVVGIGREAMGLSDGDIVEFRL